MFSTNRGTITLPVNSTAGFGMLYWGASKIYGTYFIKLANYGENNQIVCVKVPNTISGKLGVLSGPREVYNTAHNMTIQKVTDADGNCTVMMP
jgi:alpha-N-arabinofuranosidase